MIPEHLRELDLFLDEVSHGTGFLLVNPQQPDLLRKQFFLTKKNPVCTYRSAPAGHYAAIKKALAGFRLKQKPIDKLYAEKIDETIKKCKLYASIGKQDFPRRSKALWGAPSKKLIDYAHDLVDLPLPPPPKSITAKSSVALLRKSLYSYHLHKHWQVQRMELVASAYIKQKKRIVALKKKERFSRDFIQRLIVHEIGTHVLRFENGIRQPYRLFKNGLAHYLATEEGLAAYNEQRNKVLSSITLRQYAGRVIAIDLALHHPFTDVYKELVRHFPKKQAFKLALRAKRGMQDFSAEGACTKDHLYLKGYLEVKGYLEKGGAYEDLYLGKIGIEHIPLLKKIPGIRPPRFIPQDLMQSSIHDFIPQQEAKRKGRTPKA